MSKRYFWYSPATNETGEKLAERLQFDEYGTRHPYCRHKKVVCWGARLPRDDNSRFRIRRLLHIKYLNSVFHICANTDKGRSLKRFNKTSISPMVFDKDNIIQAIQDGEVNYPVIGRERSHIGGQDADMCLSMRDIRNSDSNHYINYIPPENEYRVHIFQGNIIRISKKVTSSSDETTNNWIRSRENGWRMTHLNNYSSVPHNVVEAAVEAIKIQKLDFGAVDIIYGENNNAYVLEVNTGPGLDDDGLDLYENKIREYMENNW